MTSRSLTFGRGPGADVTVKIDAHEDCIYWRLTPIQCLHYEGRLVAYHLGRARRLTDKAIAYGNSATVCAVAGAAFIALALVFSALRVIL